MDGRTAASIAAIALLGAGLLLIVIGKDAEKPQTRISKVTDQRIKDGPYVSRSKEISEAETVRVVVVPHPLGEVFDTVCVIYTHREFKAAIMSCPNADPSNLKDDAQSQ